MSDELLPYYNRELMYLRTLGARFAQEYPKVAARLQLSADGSKDPHVERLIEAVAYLNARVQHKLDDDFPELTDALLGVLYPHYQQPIPSMAVIQLALDATQGGLTTGYKVARGTSLLAEPVSGEQCRYQTGYDVQLWPIALSSARLLERPFPAPPLFRSAESTAMLHLTLQTLAPAVNFGLIPLDGLRFYLHGAGSQAAYDLYELLQANVMEAAVARSLTDPERIPLPTNCFRPAGFAPNEAILPYDARSLSAYRLLSEYFALPEKFLFLDFAGWPTGALKGFGRELHLFVYLNWIPEGLERLVSAETFRLGCTPIVNLFPHRADPVSVDQTVEEIRVVPDARRPTAVEIYSIDNVVVTTKEGDERQVQPFFSVYHGSEMQGPPLYWHSSRQSAGASDPDSDRLDRGTEVLLSLVDLGFKPWEADEWTLDVETTCMNRDLPRQLPFGSGRPDFEMPDGRGPLGRIFCLTKPTPTLRPDLKRMAHWRLVSHLSLNHLSLSDGDDGASALREILRLYDMTNTDQTRKLIDGVISVRGRRVVGRTTGLIGGFCRGLEMTIEFDESRYIGSGLYLFASVLDQFLSLYASINSFSQLVAVSQQRSAHGAPWRWPKRSGQQILL